jgi:hypothetical protein
MSAPRPRPAPFNAGDPADVRDRETAARRERNKQLDDLRDVLATQAGRRVMWRLLDHCGVFRSTFTGHGGRDAFNEGARNVGLFILTELTDADADVFATMLKESKTNV